MWVWGYERGGWDVFVPTTEPALGRGRTATRAALIDRFEPKLTENIA